MKSSVIKWLVAIGILVVGAIVMTTLGSTEKETKKRETDKEVKRIKQNKKYKQKRTKIC